MEGNLFIQHYREQIGIFRQCHEKISSNPGVEDIHQLRLAVKRLRALLILTENVCRSEFRKEEHFNLFRPLFREAGRLREVHINEMLIISAGIEIPPAFAEYLQVKRSECTVNLLAEKEKFDLKSLQTLNAGLESKISPVPEQDILRDAETEVLGQMRTIQELRRKPVGRKKLHKIRMRLKVITELLHLIRDSSHYSDLGSLEQGILQLSRQLGKWHDLEMLHCSLRNFRPEPPYKDTLKKVRKAARIIRKDSAKLRKKILKDLVKELP